MTFLSFLSREVDADVWPVSIVLHEKEMAEARREFRDYQIAYARMQAKLLRAELQLHISR